jgi:predicted nucleic acid-binding protein
MRLLADANWPVRLERELEREEPGPARRLLASQRVHVNPVSQAEFLSAGVTVDRLRILARLVRLPPISYDEANDAGELRHRLRRRGKTLSTPDAFMAVSALRHRCRLVTADKDYSGIPGLKWSNYTN